MRGVLNLGVPPLDDVAPSVRREPLLLLDGDAHDRCAQGPSALGASATSTVAATAPWDWGVRGDAAPTTGATFAATSSWMLGSAGPLLLRGASAAGSGSCSSKLSSIAFNSLTSPSKASGFVNMS